MKNSIIRKIIYSFIILGASLVLWGGCSIDQQPSNIKTESYYGVDEYAQSKKYKRNGIDIVYLTGTPYEIGLAHGSLCKNEIVSLNKRFFEIYDHLEENPRNRWLELSKQLERKIPIEYIDEMRGIAEGADIDYLKILFINTLTTISMKDGCFAFAFKNPGNQIMTFRQDDEYRKNDFHRKMMLFVIKPEKGFGFAAMLTPGWVDGETGLNEKGITVSQNNIGIKQKNWDVMPITILSRCMLQYSKTIDDIERILDDQQAYPGRLIFASSKQTASVFEFANTEKARIDMKDGFVVLSNHARLIPSRQVGSGSVKRLSYVEHALSDNKGQMDVEKALELVRSPVISRDTFWDRMKVHNRQAYIFSPATLDFWIAIPPSNLSKPACYGKYVGFNLLHELYGTENKLNKITFPANK
jgi:hypothetical protein